MNSSDKMSYLAYLPTELRLELCVYLNYRDIVTVSNLFNLNVENNSIFWVNKIQKELGYSDDFIRKYVYDNNTHTSKTLMLFSEKYLELKARKGVDFGCEKYSCVYVFVKRASSLPDFQLASDLVYYALNTQYIDDLIPIVKECIYGAISAGNIKLADELIYKYKMEFFKRIARFDYPDYGKNKKYITIIQI